MTDFDYSYDAISEDEQHKRDETFAEQAKLSDRDEGVISHLLDRVEAIMATPRDVMPHTERCMRIMAMLGDAASISSQVAPSKIYEAMLSISRRREIAIIVDAAQNGDEDAQRYIATHTADVLKAIGVPPDIAENADMMIVSPEEMADMMERISEAVNADEENDDPDHARLGRDGPRIDKSLKGLLDNDA